MSKKQHAALFEFGPFAISEVGLTVAGHPGQPEWAAGLKDATRGRSGLQWGIGDLLLYGDDHYEEGQYEAAAEATGLRRGTLQNLKSVSKAWPKDKRDPEVGWSHHALMAGFDDEVRTRLMKETKKNKLSWEELRSHVKEIKHVVRAAMQQWPADTFGVMLVTPPWRVADTPDPASLSADDLAALAPYVQKIAAPDCVTYLLVPSARVLDGDVFHVLRAWGFVPRAMHAWIRDVIDHQNPWIADRHQHLILATRGNPVPPADDHKWDSVHELPVPGADVLPADLIRMIENTHPDAPKVELFAMKARFGWQAWGPQLEELRKKPATGRGVRIRESQPLDARAHAGDGDGAAQEMAGASA